MSTLASEPFQFDLFREPWEKQNHIIQLPEQLDQLIKGLVQTKGFVVDTETTGLNIFEDELLGISLYFNKEGYYIPLNMETHSDEPQLSADYVTKLLCPVLEDQTKLKIGHNIRFDCQILQNYGIDVKPPLFDTEIVALLLNENRRLSLSSLMFNEFKIQRPSYKQFARGRFSRHIPITGWAEYSINDVKDTFDLYSLFRQTLKSFPKFVRILKEIEFPLIKVIQKMERTGIDLDVGLLKSLNTRIDKDRMQLEKDIFKIAGTEFNLDSPPQVARILFTELQIKPLKQGKEHPSTDQDVLEKLALKHPIAKYLTQHRRIRTIQTKYMDSMIQKVKRDGRLYATSRQTGTVTGRITVVEPPLQTMPQRDKMQREIRHAFITKSPACWIILDQNQLELRILASEAREDKMIETFKRNEHMHINTAKWLFGITDDCDAIDVDLWKSKYSEAYNSSKTITYGLIYGITEVGIMKQLNKPKHQCKKLMTDYFNLYPGIAFYKKKIIAEGRARGYVENILGRRRRLSDLNSLDRIKREAAERQAVNFPIQSVAGEVLKKCLLDVTSFIDKNGLKLEIPLQIHDELLIRCYHEDYAQEFAEKIKNIMENVDIVLNVPLVVDYKISNRWEK